MLHKSLCHFVRSLITATTTVPAKVNMANSLGTHHLISGGRGPRKKLKKIVCRNRGQKKSLLKMWVEKKSSLSKLMKNMLTRKKHQIVTYVIERKTLAPPPPDIKWCVPYKWRNRHILWNSIAFTSIVVTELANTMQYGEGVLYNFIFTEFPFKTVSGDPLRFTELQLVPYYI